MKMSDVFKLPVSPSLIGDDHVEQLVECGDEHYCLEDSAYWMTSNLEHMQHAAHAINHADALADALERLFESYKSLADSGDAGNWMLEDLEVGEQAIKALAAYRGAK